MREVPHTFLSGKSGPAANSGADRLVRAGRPRPALLPKDTPLATACLCCTLAALLSACTLGPN